MLQVEGAPCAIGQVVPDSSVLGLRVCGPWTLSAEQRGLRNLNLTVDPVTKMQLPHQLPLQVDYIKALEHCPAVQWCVIFEEDALLTGAFLQKFQTFVAEPLTRCGLARNPKPDPDRDFGRARLVGSNHSLQPRPNLDPYSDRPPNGTSGRHCKGVAMVKLFVSDHFDGIGTHNAIPVLGRMGALALLLTAVLCAAYQCVVGGDREMPASRASARDQTLGEEPREDQLAAAGSPPGAASAGAVHGAQMGRGTSGAPPPRPPTIPRTANPDWGPARPCPPRGIALPALSPLHPSSAGEVTKSSRLAKNVKSAEFVVKQATGTETVRTDSAPVAANSGTKVDRGPRLNQTTFVVRVRYAATVLVLFGTMWSMTETMSLQYVTAKFRLLRHGRTSYALDPLEQGYNNVAIAFPRNVRRRLVEHLQANLQNGVPIDLEVMRWWESAPGDMRDPGYQVRPSLVQHMGAYSSARYKNQGNFQWVKMDSTFVL